MIPIRKNVYLLIFSAILVSFYPLRDDSRRYIRIGQIQIPNSACIGGTWATLINSNHEKTIRVHYIMTVKGQSTAMTCDALPSPIVPKATDFGTLIGCTLDIDYKITSSEYVP